MSLTYEQQVTFQKQVIREEYVNDRVDPIERRVGERIYSIRKKQRGLKREAGPVKYTSR